MAKISFIWNTKKFITQDFNIGWIGEKMYYNQLTKLKCYDESNNEYTAYINWNVPYISVYNNIYSAPINAGDPIFKFNIDF